MLNKRGISLDILSTKENQEAETGTDGDKETSTNEKNAQKTESVKNGHHDQNSTNSSVTTPVSSDNKKDDPTTRTTSSKEEKHGTATITNKHSSTSDSEKSTRTTSATHSATSAKVTHSPSRSIEEKSTPESSIGSPESILTGHGSTKTPTANKSKLPASFDSSVTNAGTLSHTHSTASETPSKSKSIHNTASHHTTLSAEPTTTTEIPSSSSTDLVSVLETIIDSLLPTRSTSTTISFAETPTSSEHVLTVATPTAIGDHPESSKQKPTLLRNSTFVSTDDSEISTKTTLSSIIKNVTLTMHSNSTPTTSEALESASSIESLFSGLVDASTLTSTASNRHAKSFSRTTESSTATATATIITSSATATTTTTTTTKTESVQPTTTAETPSNDVTSDIPKSTYKYETLAWLSESFVYYTSTSVTTTTTTTTATTTATTSTATTSTDEEPTLITTSKETPSSSFTEDETAPTFTAQTSDEENVTSTDESSSMTSSATTTSTTESSTTIPSVTEPSTTATSTTTSSTSVSTTTTSSASTTASSITTADDASSTSSSEEDLPQYITPNLNAIIPDTSQVTFIKFNGISYAKLVSDALLTAQMVQEIPVMLGDALETSADNVIVVSIQKAAASVSRKRSDASSSSSSNGGVMVSVAIPKNEVNELQALITNSSSPLYDSKNGQLPTYIDRSYPITAKAVVNTGNGPQALADPNGDPNHADQSSQDGSQGGGGGNRLPKGGIIGICVGVGVCVYAAATVAGVYVYRKRRQRREQQILEQHRLFAKSISSPIMQGNSLGFMPAPFQHSHMPCNVNYN
ncbi:hypothetical protein [Parasitella parasitica]|uniref:Uncharacterized protein n=1 Tax=Parasitella parasitica TaxID=35722 RepID=A0A0B7NLH5_9FUNG|nr:hypothetical protein [Parasitella parasitica]